jgi:hypothetical protein
MTLVELQAVLTTLPGYSPFVPWVWRPVTIAPPGTPMPPAVTVAGRLKQAVTVAGRP